MSAYHRDLTGTNYSSRVFLSSAEFTKNTPPMQVSDMGWKLYVRGRIELRKGPGVVVVVVYKKPPRYFTEQSGGGDGNAISLVTKPYRTSKCMRAQQIIASAHALNTAAAKKRKMDETTEHKRLRTRDENNEQQQEYLTFRKKLLILANYCNYGISHNLRRIYVAPARRYCYINNNMSQNVRTRLGMNINIKRSLYFRTAWCPVCNIVA